MTMFDRDNLRRSHSSFVKPVIALFCVLLICSFQANMLFGGCKLTSFERPPDMNDISVSSLRRDALQTHGECRWYLAESAVSPNSGLGLFAGAGVLAGEMVGFPDVCIFVSDAPDEWNHLRTHSFGGGSFFGQYEGNNSRAACEGFTTQYNTVPNRLVNTEMVSPILQTTSGLHRAKDPAAGSTTHNFGIHGRALDVITAGSELTINYGDWDFSKEEVKNFKKPERELPWLRKNGWCIDNLRIATSKIAGAGRGAFARRRLLADEVVVPLPLQIFDDRAKFAKKTPEQLFVNYCFQPAGSQMMFYPYGAAFNLVNHSQEPNVYLQWSKSSVHHKDWLEMDKNDERFWDTVYPGGLILEVVAYRDIEMGEEILLDYGRSWEAAWEKYVANWTPVANADSYVYPAEMDETEVLRTVEEQKANPYPSNLVTMCSTSDWDRSKSAHSVWKEYKEDWWATTFSWCHILERHLNEKGNFEYTVSLDLDMEKQHNLVYDESIPVEEQFVDRKVPRRAIRWVERPYMDDEHLLNSFRHPIELPSHLFPQKWMDDVDGS